MAEMLPSGDPEVLRNIFIRDIESVELPAVEEGLSPEEIRIIRREATQAGISLPEDDAKLVPYLTAQSEDAFWRD